MSARDGEIESQPIRAQSGGDANYDRLATSDVVPFAVQIREEAPATTRFMIWKIYVLAHIRGFMEVVSAITLSVLRVILYGASCFKFFVGSLTGACPGLAYNVGIAMLFVFLVYLAINGLRCMMMPECVVNL
jgi:hypothetical protein